MALNQGIVRFEIAAGLNPLNDDGERQLDRLISCIEDVHSEYVDKPVRAIVFLQTQPSYVFDLETLSYIRSEVWRDTIVRRLCKMRLALELIRSSDIAWVYVTEFNCLSYYYELALSCNRMVCTNPEVQLGFPEIEIDLPPVGGVLESKFLSNSQVFDQLSELADFKPVDWQHALLTKPLVFEASANLFSESNVLETLIQSLDKVSFRRERKQTDAGRVINTLKAAMISGVKHSDVYRSLDEYGFVGIWKEHVKKRGHRSEHASWIINLAASYLGSHALGAKAAQQYHNLRPIAFAGTLGAVIIDVEYKRPPVSLILAALKLPTSVILWARSDRILMRAVELVFADLNANLDSRELDRFRRHISWTHSEVFPSGPNPVFQFGNEGLWLLNLNQQKSKCWQISNEEDGQLCLEVDEAMPENLLHVIDQLGISSVKTSLIQGHIPSNYLIRIWAIKELVSYGKKSHLDLYHVIELLREGGWGFLGRESQVEHFSLEMMDFFKDIEEPVVFCGQSLDLFISQPMGWKSLLKSTRAYASNNTTDEGAVTSRQISFHMLYFSTMLWLRMRNEAHFNAVNKAELAVLVSSSLGIPPSVGHPELFLEQRGLRRCQIYICEHWPDSRAFLSDEKLKNLYA